MPAEVGIDAGCARDDASTWQSPAGRSTRTGDNSTRILYIHTVSLATAVLTQPATSTRSECALHRRRAQRHRRVRLVDHTPHRDETVDLALEAHVLRGHAGL